MKYNLKLRKAMAGIGWMFCASLLSTSCVGYYYADGIYNDPVPERPSYLEVVENPYTENLYTPNRYKDYFGEKAQQYKQSRDTTFSHFTDVNTYRSNAYATDTPSYGGWGSQPQQVNVNVYNNGWNYGYPYGYSSYYGSSAYYDNAYYRNGVRWNMSFGWGNGYDPYWGGSYYRGYYGYRPYGYHPYYDYYGYYPYYGYGGYYYPYYGGYYYPYYYGGYYDYGYYRPKYYSNADMNLVVIMQEEAATIQRLHTTRVEVMIIQLLHKIRAEVTTIRLLRTTLAEAMIRLHTILAEATTVVAVVVAPLLEGEGTRHWYY